MSDNSSSFSNLDQYLQTVQSREKSKFRQKFILLLIAILGVLGVIAFSNYLPLSSDMREYQVVKASFNELDIESVSSIFTQNQKAQLVIEYPYGFEDDTVSSLDEYLQLVSADQIELTAEEIPSETYIDNPLEAPLFFIEGNQVARSSLTFAIAKFDTSLQYSLNLGNGVTRVIEDQISSYTYRSAGTFKLSLSVSDKLGNERSHTRTIQIGAPSDNVASSSIPTARTERTEKEPISNSNITSSREPDISRLRATTTDGLNLDNLNSADTQAEGESDETVGLNTGNENNNSPLLSAEVPGSISNTNEQIETLSSEIPSVSNTSPAETPSETENKTTNINFASSNIPLYSASKMPRFKGGKSGMARYFRSNLRYPSEAITKGVEGTVRVRFVVEPDGSISNPIIVQGIGTGCDEEAMRLVLEMPAWIPGELADKKVPVYSQISIKFEIQ